MEAPSEAPLSTRYQMGAVLGTGTFGVVYRAWDRVRGEPVALKQLRRTTPHALYRFKQEFRAVADMRHPNLVRLLELRSEGGEWFLAMELVEGVNFLDWVREGVHSARADATFVDSDASFPPVDAERAVPSAGSFAEPRLREAFRQLAEGVAALHATGTLHRDLKPNNVLVTPEGRVVVLDFSLVTDIDADEQSRAIGGTPLYMAPEHIEKVPLTAAADWYSVGVMLYEALTGLRPFSCTRIEVLSQKSATRPASPGQIVADLPADLVALCDDLMEIDPEARPSGAEVLVRLGATVAAPAMPTGRAPFVGRANQLATLLDALTLARSRPVVRVVEGPSGMGKSALVRHFLRSLPTTVVTATGRCYQREAVRYKGVDSLVDGIARLLRQLPPEVQEAVAPRHGASLVRVFPVLGGVEKLSPRDLPAVDGLEERRRAFQALRELLGRMADRWSLALFVDDIQWSDGDSAALFAELLRPPDAPPLLLLLACRREELDRNAVLSRLLMLTRDEREPLDLAFVHVDPLTEGEARQLAESLAGGASVDQIVTEAAGNPYFLDQLARRAQRAVPASLDALLRERASELPPGALRLLEGVAVAARPVSSAVALEAAGLRDESIVRAVLDAHLLRLGGDDQTLEVWHDRVREAVAEAVSPGDVRAWHRRFADVTERHGGGAELMASHLLAAGETTRARAWCLRAGDEAMAALAFERAASHYSDALGCGAEASSTHVKRAAAFEAAGKGAAAAREQLAAAATAPPAAAQSLRAEAALRLLQMNHVPEGMAVLGDALSQVGHPIPATPWRSLVSVLWRRAWLRVRGLRFRERPEAEIPPEKLAVVDTLWAAAVGLATFHQVRSADFHARGLMLALSLGEPRRMARAVAMEMLHTATAGAQTAPRATFLLALSQRLAEQSNDPRIQAGLGVNDGIAKFLLGEFDAARQRLLAADGQLLQLPMGRAWERDNLYRFLVRTLTLLGDVRELGMLLRELIRDAAARGDEQVSTHVQLRAGHLLRMAADDVEGAEEDADGFMAALAQPGFQIQDLVHLVARTELALYSGAVTLAWNRLEQAWPTLVRTLLLRVQVTRVEAAWLRGRTALAVLRSLRHDDARRARFVVVVREERDALLGERAPWAVALGELLAGALGRALGEAGADDRILAAASHAEAAGLRLHAALSRVSVGPHEGADAWLADQGVVDPERLAKVYLP